MGINFECVDKIKSDNYTCGVAYCYETKGVSDISSIVAFYTPERLVIGCDGRSINKNTKEIVTDEKVKIVRSENALIGVTGRTDFYFDGAKQEIEDVLPNKSIWSVLSTIKVQMSSNESTYLLVFFPYHVNYDGKDAQLIKGFSVEVSQKEICVKDIPESFRVITSGVLHCTQGLKTPSSDSNWEEEVRRFINYDMEKDDSVGGKISVFEMNKNGEIKEL